MKRKYKIGDIIKCKNHQMHHQHGIIVGMLHTQTLVTYRVFMESRIICNISQHEISELSNKSLMKIDKSFLSLQLDRGIPPQYDMFIISIVLYNEFDLQILNMLQHNINEVGGSRRSMDHLIINMIHNKQKGSP